MRRELTLAIALALTATGQIMAQDAAQRVADKTKQTELQEVRSELERLRTELKECSTGTQSINATTRRRVVWMRESQARAMGLEFWKDKDGNTPRIPVTDETPVTGASVLSQSAFPAVSGAGIVAAPATVLSASAPVLSSPLVTGPVISSAPIQTYASGGVVTYGTSAYGIASAGGVAVQSTAALGMDNNPHLQEQLPYYRNSWVARTPLQAYETVTYRGTVASTTPTPDHPYVIYPWHARWTFRR